MFRVKHMLEPVCLGRCVMALLVVLMTLGAPVMSVAQDYSQMMNMALPVDPAVRIGRLDNGMTYYIRANAEPRERAEFYIFHNVGAILEEDHQDGLAHFTEHMAFNGTKNFPGKKLLHFLESNGVKFGADVNAFTATEMTCYNISDVPTTRKGLLDSCVMVLCDWSGDISMEGAEIDNERGVIMEELRTREDANWRATMVKNKELFKGSKYAERNVIGTLDLLQSFPYSAIRDFYHEWYRPDLQAIIIVGDFDVDEMEARVKRYAGALPKRENPKPKPTYEIPPFDGVHYAVYTDKEMPFTRLEVYYKLPPVHTKEKNVAFFREHLTRQLAEHMLNSRYGEIAQRAESPFVASFCGHVNIVDPIDNFILMAVPKSGQSEEAFRVLMDEAQRASQNGFTETELGRAKANLLRQYQKAYDERDKTKNSDYIFSYIDHYRHGDPIMDAETTYRLAQGLFDLITVEDVHAMVRSLMPTQDLLLFIAAPEEGKETLVTHDQAEAIVKSAYESKLDPWVDNVKVEPLIAEAPKAGAIVRSKKIKNLDAEEWTLSNGIRVIVKPTTFKEDEVTLYGWSDGGLSLVSDEEVYTAQLIPEVIASSGLGAFDAIELEKLLAGKKASAFVSFGTRAITLGGNSGSKLDEQELMFQQLHLLFTQPRFDEKAYQTVMAQMHTMLENQSKSPDDIFNRRFNNALYDNHPRSNRIALADLKNIKFDRMEPLYREQMSNAGNFTFIIVGNVEPEQLKVLVNIYLGSLPAGKKQTYRDLGMKFPSGNRNVDFPQAMEMPKTRTGVAFHTDLKKYDLETQLALETLEHVLDLRYTKEVREEEGGTYGVSTWYYYTSQPSTFARMFMLFDTDPQKADKLIPMIEDIFVNLLQMGPTEEELLKAKQHFSKSHSEQLRTNRYWRDMILEQERYGADMHTGYEKALDRLTTKRVKKSWDKIFDTYRYVEVVMRGYKADN